MTGEAMMRLEKVKPVLTALRAGGPHTLDTLPRLAGMNWSDVFAVIDELSRSGTIVLRRVGRDYHISLHEAS